MIKAAFMLWIGMEAEWCYNSKVNTSSKIGLDLGYMGWILKVNGVTKLVILL